MRAAKIVGILESRGEDFSDLKIGIIAYLRRIACGQVLPELVVHLQGYPALLSRASNLPLPDQQKIIDEEPIRVVMFADGKITWRLCNPVKMCNADLRQVFARDHMRDEAEQTSWLRAREALPLPKIKSPIEVDGKRKRIVGSDAVSNRG